MRKNVIILIIIIGLAISSGAYLVTTTKLITVKPELKNPPGNKSVKTTAPVKSVDQKEIEASYQISARQIIEQYESGLGNMAIRATSSGHDSDAADNYATSSDSDESADIDLSAMIAGLKIDLMGLKTPVQLRDLHLDLVMALTKMKNYLDNDIESDREEAFMIIKQAKNDYPWLNDK